MFTRILSSLPLLAALSVPLGCDLEDPSSREEVLSEWSCDVACQADGDDWETSLIILAATAEEASEDADIACSSVHSAAPGEVTCVELDSATERATQDVAGLDIPEFGGKGDGDAKDGDHASYCPSPISICTTQTDDAMIEGACHNACVKAGGPMCTVAGTLSGIKENCLGKGQINYICLCS